MDKARTLILCFCIGYQNAGLLLQIMQTRVRLVPVTGSRYMVIR